MGAESSIKTITEPTREIEVVREADVVVVGGGPGGIGAAVAAARNGAKTVLIERYGHLGGMASGGGPPPEGPSGNSPLTCPRIGQNQE